MGKTASTIPTWKESKLNTKTIGRIVKFVCNGKVGEEPYKGARQVTKADFDGVE